jgi:Glycosyltransferase family 87
VRFLGRYPARAGTAFGLAVLAASTALTPGVWRTSDTDVSLYAHYGSRVVAGDIPYRDFFVEYPPGSLAPMTLPAAMTTHRHTYGLLFVVEMLVLLALTIAATAATASAAGLRGARLLLAIVPAAAAPLLLGAVAVQRFDLLAALLTTIGLWAAVRDRWASAGVAIALGAVVKLYPVLLLPALLVYASARGGRTASRRAVAGVAVAAVVTVGPFAVLAAGGLWHALHYQLARPLQVETLPASAALAAHLVAGFHVGLHNGSGSVNYAWPGGAALHALQRVAFVVGLAVSIALSLGRARDARGLVASAATVLTVAVTFGGVLSPQYVIWLLPLVSLMSGRAGRWATALLVMVMLATRIEYHEYVDLVRHLSGQSIVWLVVRNLLLLALCALVGAALARVSAGQRRLARA